MERVIVIPMTGKFYNLLQIALLQCMLMEFNISTLGYIRFALFTGTACNCGKLKFFILGSKEHYGGLV